jgi:hypothetical protein
MTCGRCGTQLEPEDVDFERRVTTCSHCGDVVRSADAHTLTALGSDAPAYWKEKSGSNGGVELDVVLHATSARRVALVVLAIVLAAFGALALTKHDAACVALLGGAALCAVFAIRMRGPEEIVISVRPDAIGWRAGDARFEESTRAILGFSVFTAKPAHDGHGEPSPHGVEAHVRDSTVRLPLVLSSKHATALAARMNGLLRAARAGAQRREEAPSQRGA